MSHQVHGSEDNDTELVLDLKSYRHLPTGHTENSSREIYNIQS